MVKITNMKGLENYLTKLWCLNAIPSRDLFLFSHGDLRPYGDLSVLRWAVGILFTFLLVVACGEENVKKYKLETDPGICNKMFSINIKFCFVLILKLGIQSGGTPKEPTK